MNPYADGPDYVPATFLFVCYEKELAVLSWVFIPNTKSNVDD